MGFGKAAEIARTEMADESARILAPARAAAQAKLTAELDMVILNGSLEHRLPGNLNVSFAYVEGEALMMAIKDVAVSLRVRLHLGIARAVVRAARAGRGGGHGALLHPLRPRPLQHRGGGGLRWHGLVVDKVKKLREMSPLYEMAHEGMDLKSIAWAAH